MTYHGGGRSPWHDRLGLDDPPLPLRDTVDAIDASRNQRPANHLGVAAMTCLLTGFPGFHGSAMAERLLDRHERIHCLVQPQHLDEAEARAKDIAGLAWRDRFEIHEGDITREDLGLEGGNRADLAREVVEVFHFAAVYDLAIERSTGLDVNTRGTQHVLDFARGCKDLRRFHYASTCYVSGRYEGEFTEDMLREGQNFNNYYEETKYHAEVRVQDAMDRGLPATIYRPAITVGDSETGETQKYDGPYYLLRWLLKQPSRLAVLPRFAGADEYEVNVVPRDFVVDAIDALSRLDASEGEVYQLCDDRPPTVEELSTQLADATDRRVIEIPSTPRLTKRFLSTDIGRDLTGIEPATIDYLVLPTQYRNEKTRRHLADTEIYCPPFASYVQTLVEYVREHPDIGSDAMV